MTTEKAATFSFLEQYLDDTEDKLHDQSQKLQNMAVALCGQKVRRDYVPKIEGYAETVVPNYNLDDFRFHYRLTRDAFEFLLNKIAPHLSKSTTGGDPIMEPEKQLLLFAWYMSNQQSMREVSQQFGISKSTMHATLYRMLDVFITNLSCIIKWPDTQQQQQISDALQMTYAIPGCIGFIDGTHIRLAFCPNEDQDYINRKGFPSIVLQLVVDHNLLITNAYAGWPGCTHDARVLRNSNLFMNADRIVDNGKFLIGDSAYPVKPWLITPYKDNGRLQVSHRRFNRRASSMRQSVERAIGHLKCRFRRLRSLHLYDLEAITKLILCGCILHNTCIVRGDDLEDYIEEDPDYNPNHYGLLDHHAEEGIRLRDRLRLQLE